MRFADSQVAPPVDKARIVLEFDQRSVPLTREYLAHMDATDMLGELRVFLRKQGWVPEDEREGG